MTMTSVGQVELPEEKSHQEIVETFEHKLKISHKEAEHFYATIPEGYAVGSLSKIDWTALANSINSTAKSKLGPKTIEKIVKDSAVNIKLCKGVIYITKTLFETLGKAGSHYTIGWIFAVLIPIVLKAIAKQA